MRILILCPHRRERERLQQILATRGNDVHAPEDVALPDDVTTYELAIVQHRENHDTLARLRAKSDKLHILAVVAACEGRHIQGCLAAGADDFMAIRAHPGEVLARVDLPARMRQRSGTPSGSSLENLLAWTDAPRLLSQEVGEMFGLQLTNASVSGQIPKTGALVKATSADSGEEVEILVGIDALSSDTLAELVFGGEVLPAVMADCLREIANTVGGAFKRSALGEGVTFTLSIPTDVSPAFSEADMHFVAAGEGVEIHVALKKKCSNVVQIRASALRPGMVLRHEVRNAAGALMVSAGTALTERTAERLVELCGASALFEVLQSKPSAQAA